MHNFKSRILEICSFMIFLLLFLTLVGCNDDEGEKEPVTVNFTASTLAINENNEQAEVTIRLSRPASRQGTVNIRLDAGQLVMGQDGDFTVSEPVNNNLIMLMVQPEQQSVTFTVAGGTSTSRKENLALTLTLIASDDNFYALGDNTELSVQFTENFISEGSTLVLDAGGPDFTQRAYADLSQATTREFNRASYDLGFYSGADFYVSLNASAFHMAKPLAKFSLAEVTAQDTLGLSASMTIPPPGFDASIGSVAWIDTPDGNLTNAAVGEIAAEDTENPVYILKRDNEDWVKFKVTRSGDGYLLTYGQINAISFQTINVAKNPAMDMVTVKIEEGVVAAEPANDSWDFYYGTFTEILPLGPGAAIPYGFKDYIITNRDNVKIAMIMTADIAFEDFAEQHLTGLTFQPEINAIGSSWRMGGGPGSGPSLFTDRYFVIEDGDGLMYKLVFTSMFATNGDRGEATFRSERVQ